MRLFNILLGLSLALTLGLVGSAESVSASIDQAWLTGLVLTKSGRVARDVAVVIQDANGDIVTLHNNYGDVDTDIRTDHTGGFTLTYFPISSESYTVIVKQDGETYRFTMLIDDSGHNGHHALLFRLAETESSAIDLNDEYEYYRAGSRQTDGDGKVIYLETTVPDTDAFGTALFSYHVDTGKVHRMSELRKKTGSLQRDSIDFSIDGRRIAVAFEQELKIWHVTKLERQLKHSLAGNEYFASSTIFGGQYEVKWLDNKCVQAAVYQANPEASDTAERVFLEYRTYCL